LASTVAGREPAWADREVGSGAETVVFGRFSLRRRAIRDPES
jgi:hypothetical protein